jgi:hypothetical protein
MALHASPKPHQALRYKRTEVCRTTDIPAFISYVKLSNNVQERDEDSSGHKYAAGRREYLKVVELTFDQRVRLDRMMEIGKSQYRNIDRMIYRILGLNQNGTEKGK